MWYLLVQNLENDKKEKAIVKQSHINMSCWQGVNYPGDFNENLSPAKVIWEEEFQLRTCPLNITVQANL